MHNWKVLDVFCKLTLLTKKMGAVIRVYPGYNVTRSSNMLGTPHHLKHVDQLIQISRIFEEFIVIVAGPGLLSLH